MLVTRASRPFSDPAWSFEPKWEGYRLLVEWDGASMLPRTRSGKSFDHPAFEGAWLDHPVVLDGELIAYDEEGIPRFELLRRDAMSVAYIVFDILYDRVEVIGEPIEARRDRLAALDLPAAFVRSEVVLGDGEALFEAVKARGMEGVVAKRLGSRYRPGARSPDWLKMSVKRTIRAVIGGFTKGEGARARTFGSLLVGLRSGNRLRWAGAVGTGFDEATLEAIREALGGILTDKCPFETDEELPTDATWVAPSLVIAVEFKEWTMAGRLRAASFKGFPIEPADTWETEGPATKPAS
jgi:bifunctional non-homologous end joining protein LigD